MAFQRSLVALLFVLAVASLARAEFQLECPMLPAEECAFAVSSNGHRCVLEKQLGSDLHVCQTSNVKASDEVPVEYIETDSCVKACGVDRMTIGFSTDGIYTAKFISKMCSSQCRETCSNLVDLYSNIIAGEGVTISEFCGEQRRAMLMTARRMVQALPPV